MYEKPSGYDPMFPYGKPLTAAEHNKQVFEKLWKMAEEGEQSRRVDGTIHLIKKTAAILGISVAALFPPAKIEQNREKPEFILERSGFTNADLEKIKNLFHLQMQVPPASPKTPCVLHIGQMHEHPFRDATIKEANLTVANQKDIEQLLLKLRGKGIVNLFSEGVTDNTYTDIVRSLINSWKKAIDAAPISHNGLKSLISLLHESKDKATTRVQTHINMLISARAQEIADSIQQPIPQELVFTYPAHVGGADAAYFYGTNYKLTHEGKVAILSAEHPELLKKALEALKKVDIVYKKSAAHSSAAEEPNLKAEFTAVVEEYKMHTLAAREKYALEQIVAWNKAAGQQLIPLQYGAAHDFSSELLKNPTLQEVCLVRAVPKKITDTHGRLIDLELKD